MELLEITERTLKKSAYQVHDKHDFQKFITEENWVTTGPSAGSLIKFQKVTRVTYLKLKVWANRHRVL